MPIKKEEKINRIKEVIVSKDKSSKWLKQQLLSSFKMKVGPNTVSSWCNNHTQPHLADLKKIAKVLDTDIRELLVPTKSN